jgi:hypothetical protein
MPCFFDVFVTFSCFFVFFRGQLRFIGSTKKPQLDAPECAVFELAAKSLLMPCALLR